METYTLRPRPEPQPAARFRIDYAGELNEAQHAAATTLEGPVLVIAGAGSGKTRTLVYRVARLVESGVPPGRILLLTFTRKAAEEMLRRASARWPRAPRSPRRSRRIPRPAPTTRPGTSMPRRPAPRHRAPARRL